MDKLKILFRPAEEDKKMILEALQKTGFSNGILQPHDFGNIQKSFENNHVIIHYINNCPMGFTTWESEKNVAFIHYKWILPEYVGKGIGYRFTQLIYKRLLKKGIVMVLTEPASEKGIKLAKRLKFKPLAETDYPFDTKLHYYLLLKKSKPNITPDGKGRELVIWKDYNKDEAPTQAYRIDEDMANIPVIAIVNYECEMEIRQDGRTVLSKRCKDTFRNTECLQSGGLLYIRTNISEITDCCK